MKNIVVLLMITMLSGCGTVWHAINNPEDGRLNIFEPPRPKKALKSIDYTC